MFIYNIDTERRSRANDLTAHKRFANFLELFFSDVLTAADEGISGTKIKNRREFQRLMRDAQQGLFDMVVVKDISRFARNTVDFLQSIRTLKGLGIETTFLTANMTVLGNSEFVLTIFGALAQEESANTSKRIKFGKRLNAENGRVPNLVYGYDKTPGDFFSLRINTGEADTVRRMFKLYADEGCGTAKIAAMLNAEGQKTKRGGAWTQNAVSRILANALYTGKIINGKQEVADFLTGVRRARDSADWFVTERPDLRIVEPTLFEKARSILSARKDAFGGARERQSNKHLFSTLLKCGDCGRGFRRVERTYKNTYVRWVCAGRNMQGAATCGNKTAVDEAELTERLREYLTGMLADREDLIKRAVRDIARSQREEEGGAGAKDAAAKLPGAKKLRQKYMDMYTDDLISREELKEKLVPLNGDIAAWERDLKARTALSGRETEELLRDTLQAAGDLVAMEHLTNAQLRQIVERIVVTPDGQVDVHLRLLGNVALR